MVWAYGFRPFFLLLPLAAVAAVIPLPLLWLGGMERSGLTPGLWHGHEQVFGVLSAALAGFLLTALPSWTGTPPLTGRGLKVLVGLWAAGRVVFWLDGVLPSWLVAGVDVAFLPALLATALPALAAKERRPWEFCAAIATLALANAAFHLHRMGPVPPERVLFASVILFLALIAMATGRILPVTIRSALVESGEVPQIRLPPGRRHLATATLLLLALGELLAPGSPVTGWLALAAACAQADRMTEMHSWAALRHPQVALFYLSHAWMVLGLGGLGAAILGAPLDPLAMRHALGPGAAAIAVLAVMSIVSLRHTGRAFPLPRAVWIAPALISTATALRVMVPHLAPQAMAVWGVTIPALLWSAGFAVWWLRFAPWLKTARVDGQPG